jgi:Asp-tRNA(Asn)/Glu-tRNA(Gln) amidotransferase C subunit|tara:strand:- start:994 stop:1641 length:648 start_codon:yes stop_codon:yes gene_type:complete
VNKKLKLLKLKSEVLKLERELVEEEFQTYCKDFDKYFKKFYDKPKKKLKPSIDDPTIHYENAKRERKEREEKIDRQRTLLKNAPRKVKNLYKRLATKAHPDVGGDSEIFQRVNHAYETQNLVKMLEFAGELGVSYKLDKNDEELLEDNLRKIKQDIDSIKGSIGWLWGTGDRDARLFCIQRVIDETGHTPNQEDLPKDLRKKKKKLLGQRGKEKE